MARPDGGIMRRVITFGAGLLQVAILASCTTDEDGRTWVSREVFSERPALKLADCVGAEWRKFSAFVKMARYERGKAVRILHPDLGVIFQAVVLPAKNGSLMTLGSPFEAQYPNYAPMAEKCASKA
jgi:hypothetical protein